MSLFNSILISGATGYLGGKLCDYFVEQEKQVFGITRGRDPYIPNGISTGISWIDLKSTSVSSFLKKNPIDLVIHTAVSYDEAITEVIKTNVNWSVELLNASIEEGVKCFVNTGTALPKYLSSYSLSKHQFVDWMKINSSKTRMINLEIHNMYGEGENPSRFITKMTRKLLVNDDQIKLTKCDQKRDFIHVSDVVTAIGDITWNNHIPGFHTYDIGSGVSYPLTYILNLMKEISGNTTTSLLFGAIPKRVNEPDELVANIDDLKALGWLPKVDLVTGLTKVIEFEECRINKDEEY